MFRFLLGEIAVCIFVAGVLVTLLSVLCGMGFLMKSLAVAIYPRCKQLAQALYGAMRPSQADIVLIGPAPVVLARVSSRAA